jgi:large subunit ribosomal protein L29
MKSTEIRTSLAGKNAAELQTELEALLKEQFGLRMQRATQQLTNTSKLKDVRRGIARVRTLLHQKDGTSKSAKAESSKAAASSRAAAGDTQASRKTSSKQGASATRKRTPVKDKQGARA